MLALLSVLPLALPGVETIDPQVVRAGIFRPGLAMIVRQAEIQPGVHTYKLKHIPEALDNSLWFDSQDGATISDILTHFKINTTESTTKALSIREYLAHNVGHAVSFEVRAPTDKLPSEHVSGKLVHLSPDGGYGMAVIQENGSLCEYPVASIFKLQLAGLSSVYKRPNVSPTVDVVFKVKADRLSHIRISSLEGGAAWNASYLVELGTGDASVTSKAQVAVAGLRLADADVDLVAGMPDLSRSARLDLTTGLSSLNEWLDQRPGPTVPLPSDEADPYLGLARAMAQNGDNANLIEFGYRGGLGGGGMGGGGGGFGGGGGAPDSTSMAVADRVRFIDRAIQAARLEDSFVYPFGHIDLEPGERLTRDLSKTQSPVKNHYVWTVSLLPGSDPNAPVRRVLSLKNTSPGPWPGGSVFLTRKDIPLAEVEMPFTLPGNFADIEMGKADDITKSYNVNELSRSPLADNWRYNVRVEYEAILHIQNTRFETLPLDINFNVLGDVHSADKGEIQKLGNNANWENPNSSVHWHFDLEPNEQKELHIKYAVNT